MNASLVLKPLMCISLFVCICTCQQSVIVAIQYLLIFTCNIPTPAASTQCCLTVLLLNKTKSVGDGFALDGMRQKS